MSVTVLERPIGVILDTCVTANINEDYNGFATVNKASHGLSDGNRVYIQSNVEDYNGFWLINVINSGEFTLVNSDGTQLAYIVDADITYCPQLSIHGWSCVHLPITYKLSNNRWPVNTVDTARTISSISNDNGFVNLNISGSLGTFEDLAFIQISNANDSDFDGVYQVIDKIANNDITINLNYSSTPASAIAGATIQLYYSNYNIVVRVYGGLNASHQWAGLKPYTLLATLNLIPDTDNTIKFSINEILKSMIETKNNLLLATLPNNLDFWTQFYIEYGESYDSSDGYTIGTTESSFNSDKPQFEGYAANSKLAFKNIHSGYLSDYVMTNSAAKFLTLFAIPVLFSCGDDTPDCYQDISFIKPDRFTSTLEKKYYASGILQTTINETIEGDEGVYRAELEAYCAYDRLDITLLRSAIDETISSSEIISAPTYTNGSGGTGTQDWTNNNALIEYPSGAPITIFSYQKRIDFLIPAGSIDLTFDITMTVADAPDNSQLQVRLLDAYLNVVGSSNIDTGITSGSLTPTITITATDEVRYIGLQSRVQTTECDIITTVNSIRIEQDAAVISETKQFEIECGCANQEIRLTWLNNLGGFDYWTFTAESEYIVEIGEAIETIKNIFPDWPNSYGSFADTIRKQTARTSFRKRLIQSQYLTQDQADAVSFIKSSVLAQIINSRQDRRTVIIDTDSFTKYKDGETLYQISFTILYTDDIEVQSV